MFHVKPFPLAQILGVITGRAAPAVPPARPTIQQELLANAELLRQESAKLKQQTEEFEQWLNRFLATETQPNRPTSRGA